MPLWNRFPYSLQTNCAPPLRIDGHVQQHQIPTIIIECTQGLKMHVESWCVKTPE